MLGHQITIVSNQVVVPDYKNKQLTVYSLAGEVIKHITCPQLSGYELNVGASACAVDNNSIIVTDYNTSKVFKVNISTEETVWMCDDVAKPQAVAIYEKDYVCVGSKGKISFLNIYKGEREHSKFNNMTLKVFFYFINNVKQKT